MLRATGHARMVSHRFARAAPAPRAKRNDSKRNDSKNRGRASPVNRITHARFTHDYGAYAALPGYLRFCCFRRKRRKEPRSPENAALPTLVATRGAR